MPEKSNNKNEFFEFHRTFRDVYLLNGFSLCWLNLIKLELCNILFCTNAHTKLSSRVLYTAIKYSGHEVWLRNYLRSDDHVLRRS